MSTQDLSAFFRGDADSLMAAMEEHVAKNPVNVPDNSPNEYGMF